MAAPSPERKERIPAAVMGLGYIGRAIARAALLSPELDLVAAADLDRSLVGRPLAELLNGMPTEVKVSSDIHAVFRQAKGGVLLHATGSSLDAVAPQILEAVKAGLSVVSTCEELAYPWLSHPELAEQIDRAATRAGVAVLGTGVNPGFALDRLIASAGAVSGQVRHVHGIRVVDASKRREALQRKVGAGMTPEQFQAKVDAEEIGHVGLIPSAALAALGLGLDCDEFEEEIEPVIAEEPFDGPVPVKPGQVTGVYQRTRGFFEGREVVDLELTIAVGADDPRDEVKIDAEPPVDLVVRGGIAGDIATAWAVVNAAPRVVRAEPGLMTVLDLPAGR